MVAETLGLLLHKCAKSKTIRQGLCLHAAAIKTGTQHDIFTSNHILNMYAKCGKIYSAHKVFDDMSEWKNLVTWSAMVSGYDQAGKPHLAVTLYSKMVSEHHNIKPNEFIFASAISSCARLIGLPLGLQIHAQTVKLGYDSVSFVSNSLISMYMKCNKCSDALLIFKGENNNDSCVSYNTVITGLMENEQSEQGFEMYRLMHKQGLIPDRFTFAGLFGCCLMSNDLQRGIILHCQTIKLALDLTAFVGNVIITMYGKLNFLEDAEKVFRLIEEKDVISWNTFITACSNCEDHVKALSVFREMDRDASIKSDDFTYASILSACAGVASICLGREIHAHVLKTRKESDICVYNALVNMYAKCGSIWNAYTSFNQMKYHNLVSWNTMISGFANNGLCEKALDLFKRMGLNLKPDSVTFLQVLTACNHAGLVEEGKAYFNLMKDYDITPDIEHISCLIDLLGRAGRLKEAEYYMEKYSFGNDLVVLGCLLSASRLHKDVVLGERLGKRLVKLKPVSSSAYVLLSNILASDGIWDGAAEARKMLKGSGLKKEAGHSLIEVKGLVEKFTISDFSHSRIQEILSVLQALSAKREEDTSIYICLQ